MSVNRKALKVGSTRVVDANLIYNRVLGLHQSQGIQLDKVLHHELAPLPTSMLDETGIMRLSTTKYTLKNKLQVEVPCRLTHEPQATIMDGCAILWIINWPSKGTVYDYVHNFASYLSTKTRKCDIYLVFDRYVSYSIKGGARLARAGHKLSLQTPLPPQKVVLTVTENKIQLIDIICEQLVEIYQAEHVQDAHRLVITGKKVVPVEVFKGIAINRNDFKTFHEEADVIIVQQMLELATNGISCISILCDDTDAFALLLYYYVHCHLTCTLTMESTSSNRMSVDIAATSKKHGPIISQLLAAHAISGCDTVGQLYGIGKGTVIKALLGGRQIKKLGEVNTTLDDITAECTQFIAACYGCKNGVNMSLVRADDWAKPKLTKAPKLKSLPPTKEAFELHVLRAHIQTAIWKSANDSRPPELEPTKYGCERDVVSKSLVPITLPPDVTLAPPEVLELIRCGCSSQTPCSCRCSVAKLSCTVLCACHGEAVCGNESYKTAQTSELYEGDD